MFLPVQAYSSGVKGLVLHSPAGLVSTGPDSLVLWVSGTPDRPGTARFRVGIGDDILLLSYPVWPANSTALTRRRDIVIAKAFH